MTDTAHSRPVLLLLGAAILLGQAGYLGELRAGAIALAVAVYAATILGKNTYNAMQEVNIA